jgi:RHS repeat-associated protein
VSASDAQGLTASQVFYVEVRSGNRAPQILSAAPSRDAYAGGLWQHDVNAYDADGDKLAYALSDAPSGMTIDTTNGLISWEPTLGDLGAHALTVTVSDPFGGAVVAHYSVDVVTDVTPPVVEVLADEGACAGEPVTVCAGASDDVDVQTRTLAADGSSVPIDASGCATVLRTNPVVVTFTATATDTSGNDATDVRAIAFADCNNTQAPLVTILAPSAGAAVSGPFDVVADVSDDQPVGLTWSLEISPHGEDAWTVVDSGTGPVSDAVLGTVDTTLLPNGDYDVRVLADDGPNFNDTRQTISVTGNYQLGNFQISFTDLSVNLHGIALSITRAYDSLRVGTVGDFGAGWRLGLSGKVWDTPLEPAADADPFIAMLSAPSFQTGDHVWVERPDGRRVGFTFEPTSAGVLVPFVAAPAFKPDPGVTDTLTAVGPATIFSYGAGGWRDFILSYNPSTYVLTTAEGMVYTIDDAKGLQRVEDPYGNTVDVRSDGLFHSDGVAVTFARDAQGRITRVTEPPPTTGTAGALDYGYDAAGNLAWSEDALDHRTVYTYDAAGHPNHLTQIADPLGLPVVRTVYDADGRLLAQCGPGGDVVTLVGCATFEHAPLSSTSTVADAAGNRTDLFYDARGNVILERRHLASGGTQDIETSYDANDDALSIRTDGKEWTFEYDALRRMTRAVRPGGEETRWTYGACATFESQTDAAGNTWTIEHDANCRESAVVGPRGDRTEYHWDAWGDLVGVDEPVGGSWTFERDTQGHPTRIVDPRGTETFQTWTTTGEMTSRTEADGRTISFVFDAAKRVSSESWSAPGARTVTYTWDDADRLLSASDPDAVLTLSYDPIGRLESVQTAPTGGPRSVVTYGYDGNGRVTSVSDDRTGRATYAWDALGRLTSIVQTATGATSKRVDTEYDGLSRPTRITRFTDVSGATARLRTELSYGPSGALAQLVGVRQLRATDDALLDAWSVTRDARSLTESFTDDEGAHAVTLDGDARVVAVDHPVGSALPDESYTWDLSGDRVASHLSDTYTHGHDVRAGGHELDSDDTYTYLWDVNGRMTHRTRRSDGQHADLVWDHRGRLASITVRSAGGVVLSTTSMAYDALDRRIHVTTGGVSTWPVYDGANPILDLSDAGTVVTRRLYGREMDELLAEDTTGQVRWVTRDVAGNVRDLLQTDGTRLSRVRYDAFGRPLSGSPPAGATLGFQARPSDATTGFIDLRARTYDPQTGRFLSPDPELPYGYEYAVGNPLDYHDPTGRSVAIEYACLSAQAVEAANDFNSTIGQGTGDLLRGVATAVATLTPPPGGLASSAAGSIGWYLSSLMGGPSGPTAADAADAIRQKGQDIFCGLNGAEAGVANRTAQNIRAGAPQYPLGWSRGFYTITP